MEHSDGEAKFTRNYCKTLKIFAKGGVLRQLRSSLECMELHN